MLSEEAKIPRKLLRKTKQIERAIGLIVRSFQKGGRLFYVGAGTSGRLGLLDATECPPTFGTPPSQVQAILAGGPKAITSSVEPAEDNAKAGTAATLHHRIGACDTVVGISASGTTPFVWGALAEAKKRKASTVLICFNPFLEIPRHLRPHVLIDPNLGPEVLTGSTRLKAGTATKLLLNLLSTLSMARQGKVIQNLMIDVKPSNAKLRDRAIRILQDLTGTKPASAKEALAHCRWSVGRAMARLDARRPR
jgi:N-acetylmuramic acid 6-phosphate etherase